MLCKELKENEKNRNGKTERRIKEKKERESERERAILKEQEKPMKKFYSS